MTLATGVQIIGTRVPRTYRRITQYSRNRRRGTDFSDGFRLSKEADLPCDWQEFQVLKVLCRNM